MLEVLQSLDSREIAIAVWITLFFVWCMSKSDVRVSFRDVLRAASSRPIVLTFGLAMAYLAAVTTALSVMCLWTLQQFKISVFWYIAVGIPALMDIPRLSEQPKLLGISAAKNFKLSLLLDFFVNLFKLPLMAEFLFVPFTAIVGGMMAVAQNDEKYVSVERFLNGLLALVGCGLCMFAGYKLISDVETVANLNTARDFALPIIYNLAFLPLLWILAVYVAYDSVFTRLKFIIADDELRSYARRRLLVELRMDIASLNAWLRDAWTGTLNSRDDIERSITAVRQSRDAT